MDCRGYREIVAVHVDSSLSSEERLAVQSHLVQCSKCTKEFLWETGVKKALKQKLTIIPARPGLKVRVLDKLGETSKEGLFGWYYMSHGLVAAFALLLIVAVPYLVWRDNVQEEIFSDTIAHYQKVTQGFAETPEASPSLPPAARLLDLSPWGYRMLARQTQQIRGREGRAFVYQGEAKEYLLAEEFDGVDLSPPQGARTVRVSNRDFVSYSQEGVNLIAWKEKDFVCVISSTLPKEKLLGLAREITMGS